MLQNKNRRSHSRKTRKAGFSLLEILIAVALVAIMAGVAIANLDVIFGGNQRQAAEIFVKQTAKIGLTPYKLDMGNYPTTEEGLEALVRAPAGKESRWKGPYIEELPLDPWKNPYKYSFPGSKNINGSSGYDVWSLGEDGVESANDIGNW